MSDISTITRNVISQLCAEYDADQKRISRMQEEITKLREQVKNQGEIIKRIKQVDDKFSDEDIILAIDRAYRDASIRSGRTDCVVYLSMNPDTILRMKNHLVSTRSFIIDSLFAFDRVLGMLLIYNDALSIRDIVLQDKNKDVVALGKI